MKKITLLGALLVSTAMQAQTFYWPGTRVSELTSGTQYFIYNTAVTTDGEDRTFFLYSNGTALAANKAKPSNFYTDKEAYLFTPKKPGSPESVNHWYLNSIHGIVGMGGQTNNTEIRDLYITPWTAESEVTKAEVNSEPADGSAATDPNTTTVWTFTKVDGANPNPEGSASVDREYAWNGNPSSWSRWSAAHPYAFYTVESKDVDPAAYAYYQELTARNGKLATFAFDMQKTYGLVQDGSKYYSNYMESTEGSYEALVDGNDNTYFHSSWSAGGTDANPKHYLRAELSKETTNFYFITKRRMDNNNNRPTSILVEGCNEPDGTYETITTISEGLPTVENDYFYFSNKITSKTAYKYIRFTPQTTSPAQTRFFTYSEFYVIEANAETEAAMNAVKGLYACKDLTVKDEDFESNFQQAGSAFDAQLEKLELSVNKTEANKLLADNASNYNDDPALGQYPTEAYNALKNAVESSTTSDELTAAVKAFKFSINAPVFTINGAGGGIGYSTIGKSIYYNVDNADNPLSWNKATNKYDKTMLWKLAGLTTTEPALNTTYSAMNLSDQVYLWDVENMQITQTDPANEDGQVLVKTEGYVNPIHAQYDGLIVRYQIFTPNSASAWTLQYVGESKNIEKIDDEELAAYAELQTLIPACEPFADKIGTGLNQFTSDDLVPALTAAKEVAAKDIYEYPDMDVTAIKDRLKAAKEALTINQPEKGKFYRIKSVAKNKYVSSVPVADGRESLIDEADATTVFYLSDDNRLTNSIGVNLGSNSGPAGNSLGTTFEFQINNNGYYLIKSTERVEPLYPHYDNGDLLSYDFNGGVYADKLADAWTLEEVNDEASQPKITKQMTAQYATVAAPVALNIPADVKAYTVKVDGEVAKLTEITGGVIPAGVAAVIEKTGAGESYEFTFAPSGSTANANDLQGVYVETTIPAENNAYVLANGTKDVGFYLLSETERVLGANKAYLSVPNDAAGVKAFVLDLGDLTGINSTEVAGEEVYYDLQGRRVLKPVKGIYVTKSGKKVFFTK